MTYVVQKKTKCDKCLAEYRPYITCLFCDNTGYIYEEVDLLDVLKQIEWTTPVYGEDEGCRSVHAFGGGVRVKE